MAFKLLNYYQFQFALTQMSEFSFTWKFKLVENISIMMDFGKTKNSRMKISASIG